jgi:hypothetical protein
MTVTRVRSVEHVTAAASAILLSLTLASGSARAADGVALNGTFVAFSDGLWAKTNDRFHDEASVNSTWTVTSVCTTYQDCIGHVVSSAGWSSPLRYRSGQWRVDRHIPEWQRCPDGSTAPGTQSFTFSPPRADDVVVRQLRGFDSTTGPSGACGVNEWLNITMPFTLTAA